MAKYRILVENLDTEEPFDGQPIECEGFVILADTEDDFRTVMHNVSRMKIAKMLATSVNLQSAQIIARGIREAVEYEKARAKRSVIGDLMSKFGMEDDD